MTWIVQAVTRRKNQAAAQMQKTEHQINIAEESVKCRQAFLGILQKKMWSGKVVQGINLNTSREV